MSQIERAIEFRRLHSRRPLILSNAWDPASARVIERAGALAIATTSAGVSWARGRSDGQKLDRDSMVAVVRSIVEVVDVPVTADIERGYGTGSPEDVAETVRAVLRAGARRGEPGGLAGTGRRPGGTYHELEQGLPSGQVDELFKNA
ncbi:MAG TPA: isocitrate lyase/phosphoenolpyruvate mutase family protein [Thermoanaerobaculia bacterium]|nr:isocitrate lyase/phosphoenolpyruvate mutase family protein [Thermoanaerobaculia bacterium]